MNLRDGRAFKFGDDVNTDNIISGKREYDTLDIKGLVKYIMEDIRPDIYKEIKDGDFIVAGENFGYGSSREYAPQVIKAAGIRAVIAKSFARIFFRSSINIGLPLLECNTDLINEGDKIEIDLQSAIILNKTSNSSIKIKGFSGLPVEIVESGGLVSYYKKRGYFT